MEMDSSPQQVLSKIQHNMTEWRNSIRSMGKAIIVVGSTGEGKSSLINYLAGNQLEVEEDELGELIIKAKEPLGNVIIGHTTDSQTTIPNKWVDSEGTVYWDCPGFNDTKGVEQDVSNGYYIKTLFENINQVKTVVIVSHPTLIGRAKLFVDIIKKVAQLFIDCTQLVSSLTLVVTKTSMSDPLKLKNFLKTKLIPQQQQKLGEKQIAILQYLAGSEGKIGLFAKPKKEGKLEIQGAKQLKEVIESSTYIIKPQINIPISEDSKLKLIDFLRILNSQIKEECACLAANVKQLCRLVVANGSTSESVKTKLKLMLQSVNNIVGSNSKDEFVSNYHKHIQKFYGSNREEVFNKLESPVQFLDFIAAIRSQTVCNLAEWADQFRNTAQVIECLVQEPKADVANNSLHIRGPIMGVRDIVNKINTYKQEQFKSVSVFAFDTVFIDVDLNNPGVNMSILSQKWKVDSQRVISLRGADGDSYSNTKAKNARGLELDGSGQAGEDGRPGKPGQNGGCFIGKIMNLNNVTNELNKLTIDVSGGDGGNGEDGGNGFKGIDGENGNIKDVQRRDHQCCVKRWFKQMDVLPIHFSNNFTLNTPMLETYRSEGKPPGKGGNAGCGGAGGLGGKAGKVSLINLSEKSISIQDYDGQCGDNGSAGKPGRGGKYGTISEGKYVNEMVAPQFRSKQVAGLFDRQNVANLGGTTQTDGCVETMGDILTAAGKKFIKNGIFSLQALSLPITAVGAVVSPISAYIKSDWLSPPKQFMTNKYAPDGEKPTKLNRERQQIPGEIDFDLEQELRVNQEAYQTYRSEFISEMGEGWSVEDPRQV